ncbi:MAG: hypothetical protein E6G96_10905 [Alphaproteobacteria bacterium]|nr:MAG: hypothetical protein E6G96_10905 [Alphaproteobacteria bacterium]
MLPCGGEQRYLGGDIGHRRCHVFRTGEQRFVARLLDYLTCRRLEAAERGAGCQSMHPQLERLRFNGTAFRREIAPGKVVEHPGGNDGNNESDADRGGRDRSETDTAAHGDERADKNDDCAGWIEACELLPQIKHDYKYFRPPAV